MGFAPLSVADALAALDAHASVEAALDWLLQNAADPPLRRAFYFSANLIPTMTGRYELDGVFQGAARYRADVGPWWILREDGVWLICGSADAQRCTSISFGITEAGLRGRLIGGIEELPDPSRVASRYGPLAVEWLE